MAVEQSSPNQISVEKFDSPRPARPGICDCKVCENGYIRIPDWELGRYVYIRCSSSEHLEKNDVSSR